MTFINDKTTITETIQTINGKKYNITITFNKPSEKAFSDFAKELIKIYK